MVILINFAYMYCCYRIFKWWTNSLFTIFIANFFVLFFLECTKLEITKLVDWKTWTLLFCSIEKRLNERKATSITVNLRQPLYLMRKSHDAKMIEAKINDFQIGRQLIVSSRFFPALYACKNRVCEFNQNALFSTTKKARKVNLCHVRN